MAVTLKQIADMAGVSIGTVDRALKDKGRVSPEVSNRIKAIAKSMNYKPNPAAKNLVNSKNRKTIGVIYHNQKNDYLTLISSGIQKAAEEISPYGLDVIEKWGESFDVDKQLECIDEMVEAKVSALVIIPIDSPEIKARLEKVIDDGIPVVLLSSYIEGLEPLAYIGSDWQRTGRIAGAIINMLSGGRRVKTIAITPSLRLLGHRIRIESLKGIIAERYGNIELEDVIEQNTSTYSNYDLVKESLSRHEDLDYIFCNGSHSAIEAIKTYAISHPSVKIIGVDYSKAIQEGINSGLVIATVTQDAVSLGYKAIHLLFNYLVNLTQPKSKLCFMEQQIIIKEAIEPI